MNRAPGLSPINFQCLIVARNLKEKIQAIQAGQSWDLLTEHNRHGSNTKSAWRNSSNNDPLSYQQFRTKIKVSLYWLRLTLCLKIDNYNFYIYKYKADTHSTIRLLHTLQFRRQRTSRSW